MQQEVAIMLNVVNTCKVGITSWAVLLSPRSRFPVHFDANPILPHLDNMCQPEMTTLIRFNPSRAHQGSHLPRAEEATATILVFFNQHPGFPKFSLLSHHLTS